MSGCLKFLLVYLIILHSLSLSSAQADTAKSTSTTPNTSGFTDEEIVLLNELKDVLPYYTVLPSSVMRQIALPPEQQASIPWRGYAPFISNNKFYISLQTCQNRDCTAYHKRGFVPGREGQPPQASPKLAAFVKQLADYKPLGIAQTAQDLTTWLGQEVGLGKAVGPTDPRWSPLIEYEIKLFDSYSSPQSSNSFGISLSFMDLYIKDGKIVVLETPSDRGMRWEVVEYPLTQTFNIQSLKDSVWIPAVFSTQAGEIISARRRQSIDTLTPDIQLKLNKLLLATVLLNQEIYYLATLNCLIPPTHERRGADSTFSQFWGSLKPDQQAYLRSAASDVRPPTSETECWQLPLTPLRQVLRTEDPPLPDKLASLIDGLASKKDFEYLERLTLNLPAPSSKREYILEPPMTVTAPRPSPSPEPGVLQKVGEQAAIQTVGTVAMTLLFVAGVILLVPGLIWGIIYLIQSEPTPPSTPATSEPAP